MKKFLLYIFLTIGSFINAQTPADFVFQLSRNDYSNIKLSTPTGVTITYPDGFTATLPAGNDLLLPNHTLTAGASSYTFIITGSIDRLEFDKQASVSYIVNAPFTQILQWGNSKWKSMERMFSNVSVYLLQTSGIPDLSLCTSTAYMFDRTQFFNHNISNWDVSNVKDMEGMFKNTHSFNQPLNNWNVSNVTNMNYMFYEAFSFNQPLNNWNVSNVTDMESMFYRATDFNKPLDNWNVSKVTSMGGMFMLGKTFNQPLNNWNVSNVKSMNNMFNGTDKFNQPLNNWDVSNVTDMESMFRDADSFNQPLNSWNVSNVTDMGYMFYNNDNFNQPLNDWNVSNVKKMRYMFDYAKNFNQPLNNWNVSNVNDMSYMFYYAEKFNQTLNNWDFSRVSYNLYGFLSKSGFSTTNYDLLLAHLVNFTNLDLILRSEGLTYCDSVSRNTLIRRGWSITEDRLSSNCSDNNLEVVSNEFKIPNLEIYPNPTTEYFKIDNSSNATIQSIALYTISGRKIKEFTVSDKYEINDVTPGVYFVKIKTEGREINRKIIKI